MTDTLQSQLRRFEWLRETTTDYSAAALEEAGDLAHEATLAVDLIDAPGIDVLLNLDIHGEVADVQLRRLEDGEVVELLPVERGTALWEAAEIWLADPRTTWRED